MPKIENGEELNGQEKERIEIHEDSDMFSDKIKVVCPECGKACFKRGLANHIRLLHGKKGRELDKEVKSAREVRVSNTEILRELMNELEQVQADIDRANNLKERESFLSDKRGSFVKMIRQLENAKKEIVKDIETLSKEKNKESTEPRIWRPTIGIFTALWKHRNQSKGDKNEL